MSPPPGSPDILHRIDHDLEAILRVPLTERSRTLDRRRKGLLVALPLSLAIGAITLGLSDREGWLSAINRPTPATISARPAKPEGTSAPAVKQDERAAVEVAPAASERAGTAELAVSTIGRRAPLRRMARANPSPVEAAGEQAKEEAIQIADAQPAPQQPTPAEATISPREDSPHAPANALSVTDANRLATIDAVRSLRLQ